MVEGQRLTAEREAYLRRRYAFDEDARELFAELDAVRAELAEAKKQISELIEYQRTGTSGGPRE